MRKIIFCLFLLLLTVPHWLEAQVIKINVQKGQKYLLESSTHMSDSNNIGGLTMKTNMDHKNISVYEVIATGKNEVTFQVTTTRIISKSVFSGIMEDEISYDSDTDKEGPTAKLYSKQIGKSKKIIIDNRGNIIKQDKPEEDENPVSDWDWARAQSANELFMPLFIGKEFKPGASFPSMDSFTVEKNSTSFSLNKEKMDSRDSGTYIIMNIEGGIASIFYTGTKVFAMLMKVMNKPMNSISKSIVKSELRVNINTGMVMSKTTEEEATIYSGNSDKLTTSTSKNTSTIKVTLIQ